MNGELARRRPVLMHADSVFPDFISRNASHVLIRHTNRTALASEVTRAWRAGRVERSYDLFYRDGTWTAVVTVKPPPSWFRRHGKKLAIGAGICCAVSLVARVIMGLTPMSLIAGSVVGGIVLGALIGAFRVAGRGSETTIIQKVTIRR